MPTSRDIAGGEYENETDGLFGATNLTHINCVKLERYTEQKGRIVSLLILSPLNQSN